jgi:hypothetical protein
MDNQEQPPRSGPGSKTSEEHLRGLTAQALAEELRRAFLVRDIGLFEQTLQALVDCAITPMPNRRS